MLALLRLQICHCKMDQLTTLFYSDYLLSKQLVFLLSVSLQQKFKSYFHFPHSDGELPLEIFKKAKKITQQYSWQLCTLTKWEIVLQIPPLPTTDMCLAFKRMV